jgi:flagellar hook-length control protein FliK
MQIPRIPALNPAPEPRTGVSTPDPGGFRAAFDAARPPADLGTRRGIGAQDAQDRSPEVGSRTVDAGRKSDESNRVEERGAERVTEDADSSDASDGSHVRDRHDHEIHDARESSRDDEGSEVVDVVSADGTEDRETPTAIPVDVAPVMVDTPALLPAADLTPSSVGGSTGTVTGLPSAGLIADGLDVSLAAPTTLDSTVTPTPADATAVATAGSAAAPIRADDVQRTSHESSVAAPTTLETTSARAAASAESGATPVAATTRTAAALPEGFTPLAAPTVASQPGTPVDVAAVSVTTSAAATTTATAANRPETTAETRRADAKTPAAVARAEEVNRTIAAARAGETAARPDTVAAEAVTPASGADLSNRLSRPTAQALPMPGAESAPQTLDEGAARTMPGVGRGLDALARQKGGSLVMRLDPPSLGQLRLQMQMQGGRVTVLMTAASETARSLLHDNLGSLRQALEDRGLAVDRLAVETAGRTSESSSNSRSENRGDGQDARGGQNASDRQDAGDGRSRGRRDDASRRHAGRGDGSGRPEAVEFGEVLAGAGVSAT